MVHFAECPSEFRWERLSKLFWTWKKTGENETMKVLSEMIGEMSKHKRQDIFTEDKSPRATTSIVRRSHKADESELIYERRWHGRDRKRNTKKSWNRFLWSFSWIFYCLFLQFSSTGVLKNQFRGKRALLSCCIFDAAHISLHFFCVFGLHTCFDWISRDPLALCDAYRWNWAFVWQSVIDIIPSLLCRGRFDALQTCTGRKIQQKIVQRQNFYPQDANSKSKTKMKEDLKWKLLTIFILILWI